MPFVLECLLISSPDSPYLLPLLWRPHRIWQPFQSGAGKAVNLTQRKTLGGHLSWSSIYKENLKRRFSGRIYLVGHSVVCKACHLVHPALTDESEQFVRCLSKCIHITRMENLAVKTFTILRQCWRGLSHWTFISRIQLRNIYWNGTLIKRQQLCFLSNYLDYHEHGINSHSTFAPVAAMQHIKEPLQFYVVICGLHRCKWSIINQ